MVVFLMVLIGLVMSLTLSRHEQYQDSEAAKYNSANIQFSDHPKCKKWLCGRMSIFNMAVKGLLLLGGIILAGCGL